ncbi:MAG: hypothetical protein KJ914_00375 [Gammaproteobacteria bacterium]|nr:hypothetical protein [Gammaproteobacteria bacterium]MBU1724763.1 hypothetical protein [Gammaproteobacteria bacterium]MBU2005770.1 hypothetical protein [Gammaproteobacteria bacterium]
MGWLSDIGNAVSSAAGAVGDAVEGVVDTVTDTVEDVVDTVVDGVQDGLGWANGWLCRNAGNIGCRIGNVVLGGISGLLEGVQDIVDKALDIVNDVGGLLGALLRGDLAGFIGKLGDIILNAVELVINIVRFVTLGTLIGGIRDAWQAEDLRRFVEQLVNERFASNPPQLARVRGRLGLNDVSWGLPLAATHKVFRLDSATAPLWQWHQDERLDLYAMAGLISFDSFNIRRKRTMVRVTNADGTIESSLPINRWSLAHYIDSNGAEGRIRVYALTPDAVKDFVQVTIAKFKKLGIKLNWNDGGRFEYFARNTVHDISTLEEFNFDRRQLGQYLLSSGLRTDPSSEQCNMLALASFGLVEGLGQTAGRNIREGSNATPCNNTPERNDSCCISVNFRTGSGVIYHDEWPVNIFRYVLAHEGGHYVGLCHFGHDGFQNIMFTPEESAGLSYADWGLFRYYLDNEPGFTLDDGKNVWRFLVAEMARCLDEPGADSGPVIL